MKTLVLTRHAKSSWEHDVEDDKRPLNTRGFNDAKLVAQDFKAYNFMPDAIYSSPAKRALTTCRIFMDNLALSEELLHIEGKLYDFGGDQVQRVIHSLDDDLDKVMLFGHNHAFTTLVNTLGTVYMDNLPTSGLVMIDFDVDHWKKVSQGTTKMVITPKDLK